MASIFIFTYNSTIINFKTSKLWVMIQAQRSTFKLLFYLKKNAPKKNGMVSIMGRITLDGKVS